MVTKISIIGAVVIISMLTSCRKSIVILENDDFKNGDWLLVNINEEGTFVIDNEAILQNNSKGIKIKYSEKDMYTTCDGRIILFKDGIRMIDQSYLTSYQMKVSTEIKNAFKKGSESSVRPTDKLDFQTKWDSLKTLKNCYPTIYHEQPQDTDIIRFYKYE